jgi:hypothetical protein
MSEQVLKASNSANDYVLKNNEDGTFAIKKGTTDVLSIAADGGLNAKGTTTNDSAATGYVGEYVANDNLAATVSLTTTTPANIASITLTAGDWDISGIAKFVTTATTTVGRLGCSVSTTSASVGSYGTYICHAGTAINTVANGNEYIPAPVTRVSLDTTTTVYMIGYGVFGTSTLTAGGFISARRVR